MQNRLVVLFLFLAACGGSTVGEQTLQIEAKGLWLTSNPLGAPAGALSTADNVVIRRPGVVEPRRGEKPDVQLGATIDALAAFEGNVIAHETDGTLAQRTGAGTSSAFTGTYTAPSGHPMRFVEAGGGLYFTTNTGPQRLDSLSTNPVPAGTPPGLEGSGTTTGSSGWLGGGSFATGTVTLAGGAGDVTVVINGTTVGPVSFNTSDNQTATDTASAINANSTLSPLVTASAVGAVITITTDAVGSTRNYSLTASRSAGTATASGPTLTGGEDGEAVGYRFVWGSRDGDGALLLGAPSGRILVTNTTGTSADVALTTPIPSGIVAGTHFLQVYRTVLVATAGEDPGEDMALVAEVFPTQTEITAGAADLVDFASFANGATAYFSPSVGQGLLESKEQPPLLTDGIAFKGYVFGVASAYRQVLKLTLLAVDGTDGLHLGDGINIFDGVADIVGEGFAAGNTENPGSHEFLLYTSGTAAENIEQTMRSFVRVLNAASTFVYATYASGPNDLPGKVILTSRAVGGNPLRIESSGRGMGAPSPWVPALMQPFAGDVTRTSNIATISLISSSGLAIGDKIRAFIRSTDVNFHEVVTAIASVPSGLTVTIASIGANASASALAFAFHDVEDTFFDQEAVPGSWATSAFEEPDAWPPRFRYQVGGPNTVLYRITSQGEALLFWTSDGLYRLTGNDENDFTLRPLDPTIQLVGASTPVNMGNRAMALTSQGVVSVTELGVEKISTPIDLALLPYYGSTTTFRDVTDAVAFGVAYQSENEYMLFLPTDNGPAPGDPAVQAYVYNTQTGTWVHHTWEWADINEDTFAIAAGVVNPADNYLYLASSDWIARERKDRALLDYQDADGVGIPIDVAYQVQTAKNPGALKQWTEVACLLESPQPSSVDMYFTTEIDATPEGGTITSQGNSAVRTYIPRNKSRSARLTVGLTHDAPLEKPTILGLSVVYNTSSTRVGR